MGKAGRKRKEGVIRTKSGRRSRAKDKQTEHTQAIEARIRLFGLTEQDARDQKAASFLGRLYLTGALGKRSGPSLRAINAMWEAGQELLRMRDAYMRAIKAPNALRNGTGSGGDVDESDTYRVWCKGVIARYDAVMKAITAENALHENRGSNLHAAVDFIVFRDMEMWHMVGDLRIALNAVAHHLTGGSKLPYKGQEFYGTTVAPEAA